MVAHEIAEKGKKGEVGDTLIRIKFVFDILDIFDDVSRYLF